MPPVPEQRNIHAPVALVPQKRSPTFLFTTVTILLLLCGAAFAIWQFGLLHSYQTSPNTTPVPTWTACTDESCTQTSKVDQNTLVAIPPGQYLNTEYIKGGNVIYYWDPHNNLGEHTLIVLNANPNTFVTFPSVNATYGKNKNTVWFGDQVVQGADASTFNASDLYGTDAVHAYYMGEIISGADPKTFSPIGVNYSKDTQHVYFATSTVTGADPQTIEVIDDYSMAKDKSHVYQYGKIMPGVDPKTYLPPPPG